MTRTRSRGCPTWAVLVLAVAIVVAASSVGGVRAQLLTAEEQVVGRWEVDFHGRGDRRLDSILRRSSSSSSTERGDEGIRRHSSSRCVLSFDGAGRFILEAEDGGREDNPPPEGEATSSLASLPVDDDVSGGTKSDERFDDHDRPTLRDEGGRGTGGRMSSSTTVRPILRGTWRVRPNPYCVTDRFFDELSLRCPYPRGGAADGRGRGGGGGGATAVERWRTERRSRIELRGRVFGRYGARSVRRLAGIDEGPDGRGRSRITHGTVLLVREDKGRRGKGRGSRWMPSLPSWWRRRVVIGSFRATPLSPPCPGTDQPG